MNHAEYTVCYIFIKQAIGSNSAHTPVPYVAAALLNTRRLRHSRRVAYLAAHPLTGTPAIQGTNSVAIPLAASRPLPANSINVYFTYFDNNAAIPLVIAPSIAESNPPQPLVTDL